MLFWITIIVIITGAILFNVTYNHELDLLNFLTELTSITAAIALLIEIIILCVNHIGVDGYIQRMNMRHDMLVYQYENDIYDNDNDLGKRELIEDIRNWNEDLAARKEIQDDIWIGIFVPDIYDQFEFIELGGK